MGLRLYSGHARRQRLPARIAFFDTPLPLMAQEITATAFLSVMKNGVGDSMAANGAIDQGGTIFTHQLLTCGDENQVIDLGNISDANGCLVLFRSLAGNSGTLYVDPDTISDPSSEAALSLAAGEFFLARWNRAEINVWATAGQVLEYFIIEP